MRVFFFVASMDSVINVQVKLEDVHCGSNILVMYSNLTINECQKNREVSEENKKFNSYWEERYFFANNNGKPQCLAKLQVISIPKEFLKWHYNTKHEKTSGKYHRNSRKIFLK